MTSENIRNYCEKALHITEQEGVQNGLEFLIGEKFSMSYYQLKTEHNKLKYLYPDNTIGNDENSVLKRSKTFRLSYTLTVNENYRDVFGRVDFLEDILDQFIEEIKESFPLEDIQDYLNSYPRLAFKGDTSPDKTVLLNKNSPMTIGDIFSEVEDILIINEIKSLFN